MAVVAARCWSILSSKASRLTPCCGLALLATMPAPTAAEAQAASGPGAAQTADVLPGRPSDQNAASNAAADAGDIIVTATRREQSLQSVPIAVTALSGGQLAAARVSTTASLAQQVPNLVVTSEASGLVIFLRGVGQLAINPGQEPSVATYVDGVYQPTVFG